MHFFTHVEYSPELRDNGWFSQAEKFASICRGPSRWLAGELWSGGKKFEIKNVNENNIELEDISPKASHGIQKVLRIVIGFFLSIPGELLALPFMALAFVSEEIRLKHTVTCRELSKEEKLRLNELIEERQKLAKERQGEPITCSILCSICCLLCCLVCAKS